MSRAYYNDSDPYVCAWLVNLIAAELLPAGDVDDRPIQEVTPDDVRAYTQCHFFAGIGGWAYALQLAGWPATHPIWTGSCPCGPWSVAGKRMGAGDARHLWPDWFRLVRECRPPVVFGEQVTSPDGAAWLDAVLADLEGVGFAVGAADLCAAGIGAPHARPRFFWVADADTRDGKGQSGRGNRIRRGKNGRLHVANLCDQLVDLGRPDLVRSTQFRCWLMGYPESWERVRAMGMQSSRKSRPRS